MNTLNTMSIINTTHDQIKHDCPQNTIIYTQCNHTCRHLQSWYVRIPSEYNSKFRINIQYIYNQMNIQFRKYKNTIHQIEENPHFTLITHLEVPVN